MMNERIYQIQLPDANDTDEHPRLLVDGEGIHAGDTFEALFPDGWQWIRLEIDWNVKGPASWYIADPVQLREVCPVGLFVRV